MRGVAPLFAEHLLRKLSLSISEEFSALLVNEGDLVADRRPRQVGNLRDLRDGDLVEANRPASFQI